MKIIFKPAFLSFFFLLQFAAVNTNAQVKIGNNPNTIDPNSLLEMESTDKGFLCPRVALNSLVSAAPLTAPVPEGMMVYSDGGTLSDGYYSWNGASWVKLLTSVINRSNFVLVKSAADFPAPVAGVITLVAGTTYEINGTITLTNKIDLNNCTVKGVDRINDKLIYTPTSSELFTGTNGGNIYNLTLSSTGIGSKLFNLDAGGSATKSLILQLVYILDCYDLGLVKGFGGYVAMQTVAFVNNTNGITFQDISDLVLLNGFWTPNNQNICQKLIGTFNTIQIIGGKMHVLSFFTATALDISGITAIATSAEVRMVLFVGDGVFINGAFSNKWAVESSGLQTEKDDVASGNIYISSTATTTIASVGVPIKVAGTTTSVNLFRVTSPSNNRIAYTGTKKRRFAVIGSLSISAASSNKYFTFYVAKNGVILPESKQMLKMGTGSDKGSLTLSCTIELSTNDYVEVWVENDTDATNLIVESLNLAIR